MTPVDHIAEEGPRLELNQLWMLPIILFQMICALYANHVTRLKQMRIGSLPKDWYDHHDRLMAAEWRIRAVIAEGARRILAGQPLDYANITYSSLPPDQFWSPPSSAWQTHLRMEALARFMAEPEAHIRSHVARIAVREAKKRFGLVTEVGASFLIVCTNSRRLIASRTEFPSSRVLVPP